MVLLPKKNPLLIFEQKVRLSEEKNVTYQVNDVYEELLH